MLAMIRARGIEMELSESEIRLIRDIPKRQVLRKWSSVAILALLAFLVIDNYVDATPLLGDSPYALSGFLFAMIYFAIVSFTKSSFEDKLGNVVLKLTDSESERATDFAKKTIVE